MGLFDSLDDPFSEVGELASELGVADPDELDQASQLIRDMLAERGVPDATYRFLYGKPEDGTLPTQDFNFEKDVVAQAGHIIDNLTGGPGFGKLGAAITNNVLGYEDKYEQPGWEVEDFYCEEGLSQLFRCELVLRRPLQPPEEVEEDNAVDKLEKDIEFDDGSGGTKITVSNVSQLITDANDAYDLAKNPDANLGKFSDAQDPDALDPKKIPDAVLTPDKAKVDPDKFLGNSCRICVARRYPGDFFTLSERWFSGIGVEFEDLGDSKDGYRRIRLVVMPRLWLLSLRSATRVFQDMNAVEIVLEILKDHRIYQEEESEWGTPGIKCVRRLEPGGIEASGPIGIPDEFVAMTSKVAGVIPGGEALADPFKKKVEDWTSRREHCVQYNETDLDFVERLLAEEGITYYFEHAERHEILVLTEDPKLAGKKTLTLDRRSLAARDGEPSDYELRVSELAWDVAVDRELVPSAVTLRDFSFSYPTSLTELQAGEQMPSLAGGAGFASYAEQAVSMVTEMGDAKGTEDYAGSEAKVFEYPAEMTLLYDEEPVDAVYEAYSGPPLAQHALDSFRSRSAVAGGTSNVTTLLPGDNLRVRNSGFDVLQDGVRENTVLVGEHQRLLVTSVIHAKTSVGYRNRFKGLNAEIRYRPPRRRRRPLISGLQTATVIGLDYKDNDGKPITLVDSDALDRVYVRFHWDRRALNGPNMLEAANSCWVRVAHRYGGEGLGMVFVPRVGMEVLVAFLEGNPDRPVIVGCLYNADINQFRRPPRRKTVDSPSILPHDEARKPISIIHTRSWSDAGGAGDRGNVLYFLDHGGSEEISLFAQNDLEETIGHDHITTVLGPQTNIVENKQVEEVGKDQTLHVNRMPTGPQDWCREKKVLVGLEDRTVGLPETPARREDTVKGDQKLTVKGHRTETLNVSEEIGISGETPDGVLPGPGRDAPKARTVLIRGSQTVKVAEDDVLHVSGDCEIEVKGRYEVTAKTIKMSKNTGEDPEEADPRSSVSITPEGVTMDSKGKAEIEATEDAIQIQSMKDKVIVSAKEKIVLQCGDDSIVLDAKEETITITAPSPGGLKIGTEASFLELKDQVVTLQSGDSKIIGDSSSGLADLHMESTSIELKFQGEIHFNGQDVRMQN